MLLADWERPGRLHASLWLKGPAARGPYGSLSWMTLRLAWLQCRAARETASRTASCSHARLGLRG